MDLDGKYLFAKLVEPVFWQILGVAPPNPNSQRLYMLAGQAKGENSSGFWLHVDTLYGPDGNRLAVDGPLPTTFLVPWTAALSVMVYDARPAAPPVPLQPVASASSRPGGH